MGTRRVLDAGLARGEVTHVALAHGDEEVQLVVGTLYGEERAPADAPFHAALHLDTDAPQWRPWRLEVDGREQVFWLAQAGERWAAFARVGGVRVVVAATRWDRDDVRLGVVDREAYLGGSGSTTSR